MVAQVCVITAATCPIDPFTALIASLSASAVADCVRLAFWRETLALAAGSSTTLSYSGSISLGFGVGGIQLSGVVPGQQYLVTVMGANTFGSLVVTAQ